MWNVPREQREAGEDQRADEINYCGAAKKRGNGDEGVANHGLVKIVHLVAVSDVTHGPGAFIRLEYFHIHHFVVAHDRSQVMTQFMNWSANPRGGEKPFPSADIIKPPVLLFGKYVENEAAKDNGKKQTQQKFT